MEDRMDCSALRKLQFICNFTDTLDDLERYIKLEQKLVVCTRSDGSVNVWLLFDENQIIDGKFMERAILISIILYELLGTQQMLAKKILYKPLFS
jgi:hypothetical protein